MRVLLISDIHANLEALQAVLAATPPHDAVWNLGDLVGYGASPTEVIREARRLGNLFVRGNHDRACAGLADLEDFNPIAARAIEWTQGVLCAQAREWLRTLPQGPVSPGVSDVECVHGSPLDEDEYLISEEDAWPSLQVGGARVTFFGHTHVQGGFALDGNEPLELAPGYGFGDEAEQDEFELRKGARYLLNPGSVGQPRDRDWRAAFAIFDDARSLLTWHRVPYNVAAAQEKIRAAGLPDVLADRLSEGR